MKIIIFVSVILVNFHTQYCITFYPKLDPNYLNLPKHLPTATPNPTKNRLIQKGTTNRRDVYPKETNSDIHTFPSDPYLDEDEDDSGIGIVDTSQPVDDILSLSNIDTEDDDGNESGPVQCKFVTFGAQTGDNGAYAWHASYPIQRSDGENDGRDTYVRTYQMGNYH